MDKWQCEDEVFSSYSESPADVDEHLQADDVDNIVDLPFQNAEKVVKYIKQRYWRNKIYTWAGQALIAIHPYDQYQKYNAKEGPSIETVINKAWFKLSRNLGKKNQNIVISGESGSGKTYSACLAIKFVANRDGSGDNCSFDTLRKIWCSVPLLTAFGNASTKYNNNSSRFGKLIQMQYNDGKIKGAFITTYLLEKCRVSCPNTQEGNFHIFRQVLESVDDVTLSTVRLSKHIAYSIAPKCDKHMKSTYNETIRALDTLEIHQFQEILNILAVILNLGNVRFEMVEETQRLSKDSEVYLNSAHLLLQLPEEQSLSELLLTKVFTTSINQIRRGTIYRTPCMNLDECEERKNCIMRLLYENLFLWLVREINKRVKCAKVTDYQLLGILDVYGFEIFDCNTFEQLCINYANERLHCYFINDYLVGQCDEMISEGFEIDPVVDLGDYLERVNLIDGNISIFGIVNEECLVKRFNNDIFINTRIVDALKNRKHFKGSPGDFGAQFTIKHFAGDVTYDTRSMLFKNRDKIPDDILIFLRSSNFDFLLEILKKETIQRRSQTLLTKFRSSLDKLMMELDKGNAHYIKCVKPNACQRSNCFDDEYFLSQLKINGVLDIIKLSFQNYSIKINFESLIKEFVGKNSTRPFYQPYMVETFNALQAVLRKDIHVGRKLVYLTEKGYHAFEVVVHLKLSNDVRKIQKCWRKHYARRQIAARVIQAFVRRYFVLSDRSSSTDDNLSVNGLQYMSCVSPQSKTELYVKTNNFCNNYEGDQLSLLLEKVYLNVKTKPFRRVLFYGNGIVSKIRLAEIPIRFHIAKTCIKNSHLLPRSELPQGLLDIFQ